jgi:hypothetical protein
MKHLTSRRSRERFRQTREQNGTYKQILLG